MQLTKPRDPQRNMDPRPQFERLIGAMNEARRRENPLTATAEDCARHDGGTLVCEPITGGCVHRHVRQPGAPCPAYCDAFEPRGRK